MQIKYDEKADALSIVLKDERVSKDTQLAENVFAGYSRKGDLVEIQLLDVSSMDEAWLSLAAAAKILGKSERTLLRWIEAGKLKPKKIGREYRITAQDLKKIAS